MCVEKSKVFLRTNPPPPLSPQFLTLPVVVSSHTSFARKKSLHAFVKWPNGPMARQGVAGVQSQSKGLGGV